MISTLASFKQFLRIQTVDTSEDPTLTQSLQFADLVLKAWLKRDLERTVYLEYHNGRGVPELTPRQRPIAVWMLLGDTTANSPVITNLSSTSGLAAGYPAHGYGIGKGAVISTVDSATQVTLTVNNTATQTQQSVCFGINMWLDAGGFFGQGQQQQPGGPYSSVAQLQIGIDFVVEVDMPDLSGNLARTVGLSKSGIVRRLGGGFTGTTISWPWEWRKGTLTTRLPPAWPPGYGNLRVQYVAGYNTVTAPPAVQPYDAMPDELVYAENCIAAWIRVVTPFGVPLDSGAIQQQALAQLSGWPAKAPTPELAAALSMVSRYREKAI